MELLETFKEIIGRDHNKERRQESCTNFKTFPEEERHHIHVAENDENCCRDGLVMDIGRNFGIT